MPLSPLFITIWRTVDGLAVPMPTLPPLVTLKILVEVATLKRVAAVEEPTATLPPAVARVVVAVVWTVPTTCRVELGEVVPIPTRPVPVILIFSDKSVGDAPLL